MTRRKSSAPGDALTTRAPRRANAHLMPTLLDRLRDDVPRRQGESPEEYAVSRKQMRDIIQRDLIYLLNTTNIEDQIDRKRYPEAAKSTINFGVPPLAGEFLAARQWTDVEQTIRAVIERFEPRLMKDSLVIRVLESGAAIAHHNVLSFEVRGEIHMDPYPLEFMVQSSLDLETSQINVTGARTD